VGQDLVRPAFRNLTAMLSMAGVLLLIGILGGGYAGSGPQDRRAMAEQADQAEAALAEAQMLQGRAEEPADRSDRADPRPDGERLSLAEEADRKTTEPAGSEPAPADPAGPVPATCEYYSGNRATGCGLLLEAGFGIDQMSCLDRLWTKESGWNERAENPSSGAYGIPQALPGEKMSTHGADWRTNPATQIQWGLDYIENRYGTPCAAWRFSQANNWY
jgi:hypothetical protein